MSMSFEKKNEQIYNCANSCNLSDVFCFLSAQLNEDCGNMFAHRALRCGRCDERSTSFAAGQAAAHIIAASASALAEINDVLL
jgi:hypothetical protein